MKRSSLQKRVSKFKFPPKKFDKTGPYILNFIGRIKNDKYLCHPKKTKAKYSHFAIAGVLAVFRSKLR